MYKVQTEEIWKITCVEAEYAMYIYYIREVRRVKYGSKQQLCHVM